MDKNCEHELNRQLQGLEARVSQNEKNIAATYNAMSLLAQATATEVTAVAPLVASILNGTPALYQAMLKLLSNPDALVAVALELTTQLIGIPSLASISSMVQGSLEKQIAGLQAQLNDAIAHNKGVEIIHALETALLQYKNMQDSATNFFTSQNNLSICQSASRRLGGFS